MGFWKKITSPFRAAANAVAGAASTVGEGVVTGAGAIASGVVDTATSLKDEVEEVAEVIGEGVTEAADVVGDSVQTFGEGAHSWSLAQGGAIVKWAKTSASEVRAFSGDVAGLPGKFSPELYRALKDGLEITMAGLLALLGVLQTTLPTLLPPDPAAREVAAFFFPGLVDGIERSCRSVGTTMGWALKFEAGVTIGGRARIGFYCDRGGQWGFYAGLDASPVAVEGALANGISLTVEHLIVFGDRDDFSGAECIDLGVKFNIHKTFIAGARVLLKKSNFKFLGLGTDFGLGVMFGDKSKGLYLPAPNPRKAADLLGITDGMSDAGPSVDTAVRVCLSPADAETIEATALAASIHTFAPRYLGEITSPVFPALRLGAAGLDGGPADADKIVKMDHPEGLVVPVFRLRAGLADVKHVSIESVTHPGKCLVVAADGRVRYAPASDAAAATFKMVAGLEGEGGVAFESLARPGHYLRFYYNELWAHSLAANAGHPNFKREATFALSRPKPAPADERAALVLGERLFVGQRRRSPDGRHQLRLLADGRLQVGTWTSPAPHVTMEALPPSDLVGDDGLRAEIGADGRLVIRAGAQPLWASEAHGDPGECFAAVTDAGHLAIFRGVPERPGALVWSSKHGAEHWWTERRHVALRAADGRHLRVQGSALVIGDASIGPGEDFTMLTCFDGRIALRAHDQRLVSAAGGGPVSVVDREHIGAAERFEVVDLGGGEIALRAAQGQALVVPAQAQGVVQATSPGIVAAARLRRIDLGHHGGWESLGGSLSSTPAPMRHPSGVVEVHYRGRDQGLWSRAHTPGEGWGAPTRDAVAVPTSAPATLVLANGYALSAHRGGPVAFWLKGGPQGAWGPWGGHGGAFGSAPALSSWGPTRIDLFGVGAGQALYHRFMANGVDWSGWGSLGGTCLSSPSAASLGVNHITVAVRGPSDQVYLRTYSLGPVGNIQWSEWQSLGGAASSAPSLVVRGDEAMDLFVRGSDMALWRICYRGGIWGAWERLGGTLGSGPAALVMPDHVVVYARAGDGSLIRTIIDEPAQATPTIEGTGDAVIAATFSPKRGHAEVFATAADGALRSLYPVTVWQRDRLGRHRTLRRSDPLAAVYEPQREHSALFYRGVDGTLHYAYFRDGGWWLDDYSFGPLLGAVAAAFSTARNHSEVYFAGEDGDLVHGYAAPLWRFHRFSLGPADGPISAIYAPPRGHTEVFWAQGDRVIYSSVQGGWVHDTTSFAAAGKAAAISAIYAPNRQHAEVFIAGADGKLHYFYRDGGEWQHDGASFGAVTGAVSAIFAPQRDHAEVFYVGEAGSLVYAYLHQGAWKRDTTSFNVGGAVKGGVAAVYAPQRGHAEVFFTGADGKLHYFYVVGGSWRHSAL